MSHAESHRASSTFLNFAPLVIAVLVSASLGCSQETQIAESEPSPAPASVGNPVAQDPLAQDPLAQDALGAMKAAVGARDWPRAAKQLDAVLISHASDPAALQLAARVAHETGRPEQAADLLVEAAVATGYRDTALAQRAVIGLVGAGRLIDAIELLEKVVAELPNEKMPRRLLFDLQMGVDDRLPALAQGRTLVRQRHFDADVLLMLDLGTRRKEENGSFEKMVELHPSDLRPLTGKAMTLLDHGDVEQSLETANQIVRAHPNWRPARLIQGRALVQLRRVDELSDWLARSTDQDQQSPWFWSILGDWNRDQGRLDDAIASYWQAIEREPSLLQAWQSLGAALQEVANEENAKPGVRVDQKILQAVSRQTDRLSRVRQDKENFQFQGSASPQLALDIAKGLETLGRLWEAEAWTAMAMTLPSNDTDAKTRVNTYREALVRKLRRGMPWDTSDLAALRSSMASHFPAAKEVRSRVANSSGVSSADSADWFSAADAVRPVFQDEAAERGLTFFGKTSDRLEEPGLLLYATAGCGIGAIDFDLDGWPDLACANAGGMPGQRDSGPNSMWRNRAGQFVDVTVASGTGDRGFGQGICVGDLNEDGFPDLWLANYGPNRLLINNGDGTFQDATEQWCDDGAPRWTTSAAIADLDGDGIADVWEVNYCSGMEATELACVSKPGEPPSSVCAPIAFKADGDRVYSGKPDGGLAEVTGQWCDLPSVPGRGLGVVVGSIDTQDGIDVLVTNDMTNNHLWLNESNQPTSSRPARFQEAGVLRGLAADGRSQPQGSMGIATGDFDHDGRTDVYVTSFQAEYNTLHSQSRTSGFWSDMTSSLGLAQPTIDLVGFGTQAVDMDNDSHQELFVSNGHIDPVLDYAQHAQMFQRTSARDFKLLAPESFSGYLSGKHVGRAVSSVDVNLDGLLDLAVTHQTEPVAVLVNRTPTNNHWIRFSLVGRSDARDAIGTQVTVYAGEKTLHAGKFSGGGYMSSNQPCVHFGLGDYEGVVRVNVRWPSGENQEHVGLACDREWLIVQGFEAF